MAYLYLDSAKTKRVISDQDTLIKELNALLNQVDSVRTELRYKIACRATIDARLLETKNQISLEMQRAANLREAFIQIIALYQQTETNNFELLQAEKAAVHEGTTKRFNPNEIGGITWEQLELVLGTVASATGDWKAAMWFAFFEVGVSIDQNYYEAGIEPFSDRYWEEVFVESTIKYGEYMAFGLVAKQLGAAKIVEAIASTLMQKDVDWSIDSLLRLAGNDVGWVETVSDCICDELGPVIDVLRLPLKLPEKIIEWTWLDEDYTQFTRYTY